MELTFTYLALLFYLSASLAYMGSLAARPGKLLRAAGILARDCLTASRPVLPVTFSGTFEEALTINVNGPGQKRRASM